MKVVQTEDVRAWLLGAGNLGELTRSIGQSHPSDEYLERAFGLPLHLRFTVEKLSDEQGNVPVETLASIPFYSLCRAVFLPLSSMAPDKAAQLFGIRVDPPPDTEGREALLRRFFEKDVGLGMADKIAAVLGDPFQGRPSTFRRDSLVRLLMSMALIGQREIVDRLNVAGDIAVLFAQSRRLLRGDPPLTAAEVMETLRLLPEERRNRK